MSCEFYELRNVHRVEIALFFINAVMKSIVERKTRLLRVNTMAASTHLGPDK